MCYEPKSNYFSFCGQNKLQVLSVIKRALAKITIGQWPQRSAEGLIKYACIWLINIWRRFRFTLGSAGLNQNDGKPSAWIRLSSAAKVISVKTTDDYEFKTFSSSSELAGTTILALLWADFESNILFILHIKDAFHYNERPIMQCKPKDSAAWSVWHIGDRTVHGSFVISNSEDSIGKLHAILHWMNTEVHIGISCCWRSFHVTRELLIWSPILLPRGSLSLDIWF